MKKKEVMYKKIVKKALSETSREDDLDVKFNELKGAVRKFSKGEGLKAVFMIAESSIKTDGVAPQIVVEPIISGGEKVASAAIAVAMSHNPKIKRIIVAAINSAIR